jgi:cell division protein FtsW
MPRTLQPDRRLFGVTLALCLLGAVMVFSASAMIAREQYGDAYYFLIRQLLWAALGILGMFWLMRTDYHKLRQPRVIFSGLSLTLVLLIAVYFLDHTPLTAGSAWAR